MRTSVPSARSSALLAGASILIGAYDQAAIGVDLTTIRRAFALSTSAVALLSSSAVVGMLVGGVLAGFLGDRFGRRRLLLAEVMLLVVTSLGASLSPNIDVLLGMRVIGGMAIGTGYTIAFVYLAEIAPEGSSGRWMSATLWGANFGMLVAYGLGALVLSTTAIGWRIELAAGAVFALPLAFLRRRLPETAEFQQLTVGSFGSLVRRGLRPAKLKADLPAMAAWFSYQVSDQGISLFLPAILAAIFVKSAASGSGLALITKAVTIPASFVTIFVIDRLGRRRIQSFGFLVRGLGFSLVAGLVLIDDRSLAWVSALLLAVAIAAGSFGPDKTTVITPTSLSSTDLRATTQGIAQIAGRLGGIVGPILFVYLETGYGIWAGIALFAGFSLVGAVLTQFVPDRSSPQPVAGQPGLG